MKKRVDVLALSIYGLVVFPKALGHMDEAVSDLFHRLDKRVTSVSAILAETFRSLSACRRMGEGRFIRCVQLLDFDWVPLLGIWGAVGYAPLLVLRKYRSRLAAGPMRTPEYSWWWGQRVTDNIPVSNQEAIRPLEEHLQVIPL
ncbi:hypothetical protein PVK06_001109 [Gossypium arboreum]|uniref:DUF7745 domain-containing protein n=1 Tax=Gossypium arboreum TaxID=29729 RepID=A0ABR0R057_GOSAR|nr:hypothetical protein PVK06_001109 [Gossypium arboreum]